ncbi:hypothetical protein B9Z55_022123 [Caenorhabditis nigoni]|uniref:Protein kinase domain-containing protein n=1 Tax=Caenorhabditis nigoni TaxID=1611254 RepID=A0A2G5TV26_9PELO|nr:hypothetical protein B9Z55_022123 [Caenorhabditis nigoni]
MNAEDQADYVKPGQTIISSSGRSIEFGQKIGAGAFGQVFAGRIQKENGEQGEVLACKMVPYEPGEESEAEEEINILKMLINVKNIVSLEEAFDVHFDDQHYKIMCFEKLGPSLAHMLQNRKICVPNALKVGLIVLDVFAELEKIGVLYQDLHPGNLLFSHNLSHLKVTDFGNSEVAKRNKKPRKDGKNFLYIFDAISVGFLVLCCRGATTMIRPTATISSYVNSLKHVKETLLEHDSLFLSAFLDEGIEQLRSELSYSKLRKALTSSVYTFNPKEPFIVTQGVPPMLT